MALRGNLKDFSLPDVFQLVTLSGKTGILRIKRADSAEGSVWFRDGDVFFAQSNWQREPLGERMVSAGKITPSALARVLEIQRSEPSGGRRLGQLLVDEGYITDKVLEAFVQEQIQDTIFDLFRWDEGAFDFEPLGDVPGDEDIGLAVSIENIVMEGSRRLEEWNRIKKKIPSMDIVFKMATAPGEGTFEISLKPIEWNLLLLVDGTRSVAELATATARTDFEVSRVLYGLFSAGLLEVASDEEVERLRAERAKLEQRAAAARPAAAAAAAPSAAPAAEETPAEPRAEPEMPEFLSGAQSAASAEDMAVFQEMMGAVLEPPEPSLETAAPGQEAPFAEAGEVVFEPVPPEAEAYAEAETVAESEYLTPDVAVTEPMSVAGAEPVETFPDIVHEPPPGLTEDLLSPIAEDAVTGAIPVEPAVVPEDLSIAEIEAMATAADLSVVPLPSVSEGVVEPAAEPGEEDLSALLSSLREEAGPAAGEVAPAEVDTGVPVEVVEPSAEEPTEVISTDAFLSDFDEPVGGSLSVGLGDELTALTGGGRAPRQSAAPTIRTNTSYDSAAVPHRDQMVDKDLVMKVIDGIRKL